MKLLLRARAVQPKHESKDPNKRPDILKGFINATLCLVILVPLLAGCITPDDLRPPTPTVPADEVPPLPTNPGMEPTQLPARPNYPPGTLVDYIAQTGDTLVALAEHFNTSVDLIFEANPIIPADATTMPPGFPMKMPIRYEPSWGTPYQVLPDSLFINGPEQIGFNTIEYVESQPGWLKNALVPLSYANLRGGQIVDQVALEYSVSPRLLLAMLEYQTGALTQPDLPDTIDFYTMGVRDLQYKGVYRQLVWTATKLNEGYYGWRAGTLNSYDRQDGLTIRPDPWQNAASVAIQVYYAAIYPPEAYNAAVNGAGLAATYARLFGDQWANVKPHIEGSLHQPEFRLPFSPGSTWAYTGGPHAAWGTGMPYAAIDFAPPLAVGGCSPSDEQATAMADGLIIRKGNALIIQDLDSDGDEHTGWTIMYLHLRNDSLPAVGQFVKAGEPIGYPSCEGGRATGTHVHVARKYNGEWMPAGWVIPFNLEGWVASDGPVQYEGYLTGPTRTIRACVCSDQASQIRSTFGQ